MMKKFNIIIENSIFYDVNLYELNHFLNICTICRDRQDLTEELNTLKEFGAFEHLEEKGIRYGFGHSHFWFSELQDRNEWKRIIYRFFRINLIINSIN
jgi:hypothetical protein